jgi:phenylacetate-CoA ligase
MSDWYQPVVKHVVFPLHAMREGNGILGLLRELERTQYLEPAELADLQLRRLRRLLVHARDHCPFYRDRFAEAGLDVERVQAPADLRVLPLLTKQEIQTHHQRMRADNIPPSQMVADLTGGSTGEPLRFWRDRARTYSRDAAALRHDRWTGWDIGEKTAYIWGHRRDLGAPDTFKLRWRNRLLDRRLVLDSSSLSRRTFDGFRRALLRSDPAIYIGYANSLYLYVRYLEETGGDYHRPRAVITSAEMLAPERRAVIERVLGCRVFDRYGSRETSVIASECEQHTGLHICAEALLLEFVRQGEPVAPGEPGLVVITDLLNLGMPLIRYRIEDVAVPAAERCPCGRGLPLLGMTAGRVTDFLVTSEGTIVSGASLTIFLIAKAPGVKQAQIVQERVDEITLRVVKGPEFGEQTLQFFATEIPRFFGQRVRYELEFVDAIPPDRSGKHRFSISHVDPASVF